MRQEAPHEEGHRCTPSSTQHQQSRQKEREREPFGYALSSAGGKEGEEECEWRIERVAQFALGL